MNNLSRSLALQICFQLGSCDRKLRRLAAGKRENWEVLGNLSRLSTGIANEF